MSDVLHIIDAEVCGDSLRQLAAVVGPGESVLSFGPVDLPGGFPLPIRRIHKPLGWAALASVVTLREDMQVRLVHAWSISAGQAGESIARRQGCGMVVHMPYFPPSDRLDRLAMLLSSDSAVATVPTEVCRARLVDEGLASSAIHVFPPAAATMEGRGDLRAQTRRALGVADGHCLIVAPGPLTRQAGHKYACWAFAVLRQIRDDLRLLIPGSGPAEPFVRGFVATLEYEREIFLTDERISLQEALAAADMMVFLPTGDCPIVSLAAGLAAGLPMVVWGTCDVHEVTGRGEAAALCPVGDVRSASAAMLRLLDDRGAAQALARACAAWGEKRFGPATVRARLGEIRAALGEVSPA